MSTVAIFDQEGADSVGGATAHRSKSRRGLMISVGHRTRIFMRESPPTSRRHCKTGGPERTLGARMVGALLTAAAGGAAEETDQTQRSRMSDTKAPQPKGTAGTPGTRALALRERILGRYTVVPIVRNYCTRR
jgi:hypothetical protein